MRRFVLSFCFFCCLSLPLASDALETGLPAPDAISSATRGIYRNHRLRIGVITLSETPRSTEAVEKSIGKIRNAFAPFPIEVLNRVPSKDLEAMIKRGEVDAFIASSGFYWRMMRYGSSAIATQITPEQPNPNHGTAVALIVPRESSVYSFSDLMNLRLSASYPTAFMSYRIGAAELASEGYDPEHFFSSVLFLGDTQNDRIAKRLDSGEADAAMVRACWLESQPPEVQLRYRVIEQRSDYLSCAHSTRTYPNIVFAVTQGSPPGFAAILSRVLLSEANFNGYRWGIATDFRSVDRLQKELKIEEYAYLRESLTERWLRKYWPFIAIAALMIAGLALHGWRAERLVKNRTAELRATLGRERLAQEKLDQLRERMDKLQKVLIIGELSSMIAHELSQPLGAMNYYCDGIKRLAGRTDFSASMLRLPLQGIGKALKRVRDIVDKVRNYAKGTVRRDCLVPLEPLISECLTSISRQLADRTSLRSRLAGAAVGDPVELEILFHNLLKNAFEAAAESENPEVSIEGAASGETVTVLISNSGRVLSEEDLARLGTPLITNKESGHGLGLGIASSIAEASGGSLKFRARESGGLSAEVTLKGVPDALGQG